MCDTSMGASGAKRTKFDGGRSGNINAQAMLGYKTQSFWELFELGQELGRGQFGVVYVCTAKETGVRYAVKIIQKRKLISPEDIEDVRREIAVMTRVAGHPNVVRLKGVLEDSYSIYMVMDLCTGGELFDRIIQKGHYTECLASAVLRTIVHVLGYCHSLGVVHRDLKPENLLMAYKEGDTALKVGDFGLSCFYQYSNEPTDLVGSAYYVAPEVILRQKYGPAVDIWSAGIVLYILLCGVPPFWGETEKLIFEEVLHGELDLESEPWPHISDEAKDLLKHMLERNPKTRYTAEQVLQHPWVAKDGVAKDEPLDGAVVERLKEFCSMTRLKKVALVALADLLSADEIKELRLLFQEMDTDRSGAISLQELKAGLEKHSAKVADSELCKIMTGIDVNHNGVVDYDEFIAATMQLSKMQTEENMMKVFSVFDNDNCGYITVAELKQALQSIEGISDDISVDEIIKEVDQNGDGQIDYAEFCAMMRGASSGRRRHHSYKALPCIEQEQEQVAQDQSRNEEYKWGKSVEESLSFMLVPLPSHHGHSGVGVTEEVEPFFSGLQVDRPQTKRDMSFSFTMLPSLEEEMAQLKGQ